MWNIVASALLVGAPIVLYDGSPAHPDPQRLWQIAADQRVAVLGVSPGYLLGCAKAGLRPGRDLDLGRLNTLGSTGSPLPAAAYHWVHDNVGRGVQVASSSGGTDVASGFAGSAPTTDVWAGEISAPNLGVALAAWNDAGQPLTGRCPAGWASSSSQSRCRRCRCGSGAIPTARATGTPTSPPSPASGGTATGWR